jgi:GNAT superfamily N-acetyltransferase
MANTDAPAVERLAALTPEALTDLQRLVVDSHWNQLPADWALFHTLGSVHAVRDRAGALIASGAVLPMGHSRDGAAGVSWISMILVTPARRGQGLGRAVFESCLNEVRAQGRVPMLDATPQGESLYAQFGFEAQWRFTRWRRPPRQSAPGCALVGSAIDPLIALDRQALGFDRQVLLTRLAERSGSGCAAEGQATGLWRAGRTAVQIGPLVSAHEPDAAALIETLAQRLSDALVIDVPQGRTHLEATLTRAGFAPERPFARMVRSGGLALAPTATELVQAVAGPEYA